MFERYTEPVRRAIFHAGAEASRCGSLTIDPQHLLVGVLLERPETLEPGMAWSLDRSRLQAELPASSDIALSEASKLILATADSEAEALADLQIGPEHLLLALIQEDEQSKTLLSEHGVDAEHLKAALCRQRRSQHQICQEDVSRAGLHDLVDSLPEGALRAAGEALQELQLWPPPRRPAWKRFSR
jgi:ATP-dependent Clp protease ATP-binding subunit ClpA